ISENQNILLSLETDFLRRQNLQGDAASPAIPRIFHTWSITTQVALTDVGLGIAAKILAALAAMLVAVVVYGAIVFYNPLLRQVSAGPNGLLSARIDDLPQAKWLLQLAFRLKSVLAGADVAPARLDAAIAYVRGPDPEARARALAERLELDLQGAM